MPSQGNQAITSIAVEILPPNANRRSIWLMNTGSKRVYIGYNSSVSTSNPYLRAKGSWDRITFTDYRGAIWGVCSGIETSTIAYLEL